MQRMSETFSHFCSPRVRSLAGQQPLEALRREDLIPPHLCNYVSASSSSSSTHCRLPRRLHPLRRAGGAGAAAQGARSALARPAPSRRPASSVAPHVHIQDPSVVKCAFEMLLHLCTCSIATKSCNFRNTATLESELRLIHVGVVQPPQVGLQVEPQVARTARHEIGRLSDRSNSRDLCGLLCAADPEACRGRESH